MTSVVLNSGAETSGAVNAPPVNRAALLDLLAMLDRAGYEFVPPTPLTHWRALANGAAAGSSVLRRLFGWSAPVDRAALPAGLLELMIAAGIAEAHAEGIRSTVRVARCGGLFVHSAFPTDGQDAVFFGPDSVRFARLIAHEIGDCPVDAAIVDIGTGSGVGALIAARLRPAARVVATDINPVALDLARVNATFAGLRVDFVETGNLDGLGRVDLAVANPPYIIDTAKRRYRDGGDRLGTGVALGMAAAALAQLSARGRLILYTGSPIVDGRDPLRDTLEPLCALHDATLRYDELDPDVFGEELERTEYAGVERIALIAAVAQRR